MVRAGLPVKLHPSGVCRAQDQDIKRREVVRLGCGGGLWIRAEAIESTMGKGITNLVPLRAGLAVGLRRLSRNSLQ
jgi:hypothetical protein